MNIYNSLLITYLKLIYPLFWNWGTTYITVWHTLNKAILWHQFLLYKLDMHYYFVAPSEDSSDAFSMTSYLYRLEILTQQTEQLLMAFISLIEASCFELFCGLLTAVIVVSNHPQKHCQSKNITVNTCFHEWAACKDNIHVSHLHV